MRPSRIRTPPLRVPFASLCQTRPIVDRRREHNQVARRIPAVLPVRMQVPGANGRSRELWSSDISRGGIFLRCTEAEAPPIHERIEVQVGRPGGGHGFSARGRVVWRRAQPDRLARPAGFGIAFDRLEGRAGSALIGIIELLQRRKLIEDQAQPPGQIALLNLDDICAGVQKLLAVKLPPELEGLTSAEAPAPGREAFLWRWAYHGVSLLTFPCVDAALSARVNEIKMLIAMFLILLDEVKEWPPEDAHRWSPEDAGGRQQRLFTALCSMLTSDHAVPAIDHAYLVLGRRLSREIRERISALSRYPEFAPLVMFDLQELVQAARYQFMLRRSPWSASETESMRQPLPGIPLLLSSTIDLCAAPGFDERETGLLREVICQAQRMAHAGYLLAGWEHLCQAGDLSNAVVAMGLSGGTLSTADLTPLSGQLRTDQLITRIIQARAPSALLSEWLRDRQRIRDLMGRVRSVQLQPILGLDQQVTWMQLKGRGVV